MPRGGARSSAASRLRPGFRILTGRGIGRSGNLPFEKREPGFDLASMLAVTNLRKSFVSPEGGPTEIVNVPRFSLGIGEQAALRGESGTGKTTFLHLIAGILAADGGRVEIGGADMAALSEAKRDRLRAE